MNGQLVMWDMKEHADKISNNRGNVNSNQKKTVRCNVSLLQLDRLITTLSLQAMFGEEVQADIPTVRYCAVSSIEGSHHSMISSLQWVPSHFEVTKFVINDFNQHFWAMRNFLENNVTSIVKSAHSTLQHIFLII